MCTVFYTFSSSSWRISLYAWPGESSQNQGIAQTITQHNLMDESRTYDPANELITGRSIITSILWQKFPNTTE